MSKLQKVKEIWNADSDSDWYKAYRTEDVINKIIENPESAFHPTVFSMLKDCLGSFEKKKILVPSSGDNHAVFAFYLLGADVTSADLSERQIENAKVIANAHDWNIDFHVENTMTLSCFDDNQYDMVYTSNGVLVWIDDLEGMFGNIKRVLKPNGKYIFYDIHPFTRPFANEDPADNLEVKFKKPYDQTDMDINRHWRMQDLLNALVNSGMTVKHIEEMYPTFGTYWFESSGGRKGLSDEQLKELYDWTKNPLAAIPTWLAVYSEID